MNTAEFLKGSAPNLVKSVKHLLSKTVQDSHLSPATCSTATVMSLRKILASVILKHVKSEMNQHEPDEL